MANVYDVTTWTVPGNPSITAASDVGAIINSIIADIKAHQPNPSSKPGGVVYIPPGDYSLKTRVVVDISYLIIKGSGHGFTSQGIRYNSDTTGWYELAPGGSHVKVENTDGHAEGFLVSRGGNPRLSSVVFRDFCIDGVNFTPNENSYTNGKTGVRVATGNDSFLFEGMCFTYLEHGLVIDQNDALSVTNNYFTENGNCLELTTGGYASKITNNLFGAGPTGFTVFAEGQFGLLISSNNMFPRGKSLVHLKNTNKSTITSNRFHAFYPGMITTEGLNKENLIGANHFYRESETYAPFQNVSNGLDDLFGMLYIAGDNNMVTGNLFDYFVNAGSISPSGGTPTIILVKSGDRNRISDNHVVANVGVHNVVLDGSTTNTTILDSGAADAIQSFSSSYTLRPTP